jgi:hypothetical protein
VIFIDSFVRFDPKSGGFFVEINLVKINQLQNTTNAGEIAEFSPKRTRIYKKSLRNEFRS